MELKEKEVQYSCSIQLRQEPTDQRRTSSEDTEMMRTRIRYFDFTLRIQKRVYERSPVLQPQVKLKACRGQLDDMSPSSITRSICSL